MYLMYRTTAVQAQSWFHIHCTDTSGIDLPHFHLSKTVNDCISKQAAPDFIFYLIFICLLFPGPITQPVTIATKQHKYLAVVQR